MKTIGDILEKELDAVVKQIGANIVNKKKEASGVTRRNITDEVSESQLGIRGVIFAPDYIDNLETGTPPKPGFTIVESYDFADKIADWAIDKNIDVDDLEVFSFRTASKILDRGSKQYRANEFTNVFTDEMIKFKKNITGILSNAYVIIISDQLNESLSN